MNLPTRLDFENLSGQKFTRLLIIEYCGKRRWLCRCDCGVEKIVAAYHLKMGKTRSCGCFKKPNIRAKYSPSVCKKPDSEYVAYFAMKSRCYNPKDKGYKHYGGRGIKVCDRWLLSYNIFFKDMGARPNSNLSIERVDVNGDYTPENCIWATRLQQASNKVNTRRVTINGTTKTFAQWCVHFNIKISTAFIRSKRGWPDDKVFLTPVRGFANMDWVQLRGSSKLASQ